MLLEEHHFNSLSFLAMVSELVVEVSLDWDNLSKLDRYSWSVHVLHHLLTHSFMPSAAILAATLAALLDQEANENESNDGNDDPAPATMLWGMMPWSIFFFKVSFIVSFFLVPRLGRLCWIVDCHLVSIDRSL
jgi:hypothetical protein